MFDVIWTDPNRELVGEHRAKKDRKKEQKQASKDRPDRNSLSARSSLSSGESPFSFLKSKGFRQAWMAKGSPSMESVAVAESTTSSNRSLKSPLQQSFDIRKNRRTSALSATGIFSPQDSARPSRDQSMGSRVASTRGELSPILTCYDSIFSGSPDSDGRTSNSILERASDDLSKHAGSAAGDASSLTNRQAESLSLYRKRNSNIETLASQMPTSPRSLTPPPTPMKGSSAATTQHDEFTERPIPPPKNPLRRSSQRYSAYFKNNNPDTLSSPSQWKSACGDEVGTPGASTDQKPVVAVEKTQHTQSFDFAILQDEVARMAMTSPLDILERMKGICDAKHLPAGLRLGTEQLHWMLSILHHLDAPPPSLPLPHDSLVLYDQQDTVAYLSALHPDGQTYHLSEEPLSHGPSPIIHPLPVPYVSAAFFPTTPHNFDEAYSFTLPSTCPSSEIPGILKNVNRTLRPGGALRLTLIDPMPRTATLGRSMRSWLENNLLSNLRKRYRCTQPRQLFSQWLGEAALRGPGSTLTTTKFYAMPENVRQGHERNPDPLIEETWADRETKAELRSLVGRSLWMLVWGPYVTAETWWWDDPACVEECLQLGTVWEYHQICAVKDDSKSDTLADSTVQRAMI